MAEGCQMYEGSRSERLSSMERVARRILKAEADDEELSYWVNKTPEERLEALAVLRQRHEGIFPKGFVQRAIRRRVRRVRRRKLL